MNISLFLFCFATLCIYFQAQYQNNDRFEAIDSRQLTHDDQFKRCGERKVFQIAQTLLDKSKTFRVQMKGKNSSGNNILSFCMFELFGIVIFDNDDESKESKSEFNLLSGNISMPSQPRYVTSLFSVDCCSIGIRAVVHF